MARSGTLARTADTRARRGLMARIVGAESDLAVHRAVWGYVFLFPWALGLVIFFLGPIFASAYYGFTEYDVLSPPRFIGVANYAKAFTGDELFWGKGPDCASQR